jgi:hypothetical protein
MRPYYEASEYLEEIREGINLGQGFQAIDEEI